jgi:hypothetical protein
VDEIRFYPFIKFQARSGFLLACFLLVYALFASFAYVETHTFFSLKALGYSILILVCAVAGTFLVNFAQSGKLGLILDDKGIFVGTAAGEQIERSFVAYDQVTKVALKKSWGFHYLELTLSVSPNEIFWRELELRNTRGFVHASHFLADTPRSYEIVEFVNSRIQKNSSSKMG